jgi:DNA-binding XRE family transcriptional regulator
MTTPGTLTEGRFDELLERVRSRRLGLPVASERKRIREDAGCSLREMAAAVGTSAMTIRRWENGARPRDPQHLTTYRRLLTELERIMELPAGGDT